MTPETPDIVRRQVFARNVADAIVSLLACACPSVERPGLLVALSGGPDSTALLLGAVLWRDRTGAPLVAAHLNHGLRGEAADRDEQFCRELCARHGVPLRVGRDDPRPVARARGGGLEEAGRHLRRRFLESLLDAEPDLDAVATGHHRDDQTETVLMRLLRGTGPEGLRGIRPVAGRTIHPLLGVTRAEIAAFLAAAGQPWREDTTNLDGGNVRARLRREVLPLLRDLFGPGCDDAPARLAELMDDEQALLDGPTDEALARCRRDDGLDADALAGLPAPLARRVLRRWLAATAGTGAAGPEDLALVHLEAVRALLADGASGSGVDLPGGRRVVRSFGRLEQAAAIAPRRGEDYRIHVTREPTDRAAADGDPGHGDPDDETTWRLTCPASCLAGNLRVRNWRRGDRLRLLGLDGSKKLSDLFRDRRLPASARADVLVVEDDEGILWVVGLARAERTRLLPAGGPAVTLSVSRRRSPGPAAPGRHDAQDTNR
ncbi:MAG TPA: tRNA lysidine(34) synthetase TilS [Candidatus Krumholzibacteria bacterium]|nr:tRNA lysidine(34) synthetase TilS [Candidatus Krumholzibacteria bacterium]